MGIASTSGFLLVSLSLTGKRHRETCMSIFKSVYHNSKASHVPAKGKGDYYYLQNSTWDNLAREIRDDTPTHSTCFLGPEIHPDHTDRPAKGLAGGNPTAVRRSFGPCRYTYSSTTAGHFGSVIMLMNLVKKSQPQGIATHVSMAKGGQFG
jgi:hypothetical protein